MAEEVLSDISANVWKVVVSVGDKVAEGDELMILESMKMEIPVIAEDGGNVRALHVAEGDSVQVGQLLVTLD